MCGIKVVGGGGGGECPVSPRIRFSIDYKSVLISLLYEVNCFDPSVSTGEIEDDSIT